MLEAKGKLLRNYTQNIDTLEQVAGIKNIVQCHGKAVLFILCTLSIDMRNIVCQYHISQKLYGNENYQSTCSVFYHSYRLYRLVFQIMTAVAPVYLGLSTPDILCSDFSHVMQ